MPNSYTPAGMSSAKLVPARKIKSVFHKLLHGREIKIAMDNTSRYLKIGENLFAVAYNNRKQGWEDSVY